MSFLKVYIVLYLVAIWSVYSLAYIPPRFEIKRLSTQPIISSWNNNSDFLYNYNSAFMPIINDPNADALLVRVQDLLNNSKNIYDVGPSKIAVSQSIDHDPLRYSYISEDNIIIDTDEDYRSFGAEDPRIVLYNGTYYLFYTAVSITSNDTWRAQLALATCDGGDCLTKGNWISHDPLFPDVFWSKSGSLLIHNSTHRYLFFNDSNISIAETNDLIHYRLTNNFLLRTRTDYFDSTLVEAGPEPLRLSDKNYLFLYNSARQTNIPNPKPGWTLEYNLGWTILNGENPTEILARSEQPLLSPELDWEKCDNSSSEWANRGLTPLVIFVEGWKKTAEDTFLIWYQGCDSAMGLAELKVYFSPISRANITTISLLVYFLLFFSIINKVFF